MTTGWFPVPERHGVERFFAISKNQSSLRVLPDQSRHTVIGNRGKTDQRLGVT